MNRVEILAEASQIVSINRNSAYGEPEDNFRVIAHLWYDYLAGRGLISSTEYLQPFDVAAMMILMKISRLVTSPEKQDHWVDIAGYAACGGGIFNEFQVQYDNSGYTDEEIDAGPQ